jgi:hypothetical protein
MLDTTQGMGGTDAMARELNFDLFGGDITVTWPDTAAQDSPDKRLLAAVLMDAIETVVHPKKGDKNYQRWQYADALDWFSSRYDNEPEGDLRFEGLTFRFVCSQLGLSPSFVRKKINQTFRLAI